jgi:DNA-binding NarL/FixJ family response regulator
MIKVLIADDQNNVRTSLKLQFRVEKDFLVVGEAKNGEQALQQAALLHPDITLMDLNMPGMDGLTATSLMGQVSPDCKVVILSIQDDPATQAAARSAGAAAFVPKSDVEILLGVIRQVFTEIPHNSAPT